MAKENSPMTIEQLRELLKDMEHFSHEISDFEEKINPYAHTVIAVLLSSLIGKPENKEMSPEDIAHVATLGFNIGLYFGYQYAQEKRAKEG